MAARYEQTERRSPTHLAERREFIAHGIAIADKAVNCFQCHFYDDNPPEQAGSPIAWAPDFALVRERLREEWVEDWLWNPLLIYPGTAMPANFLGDPPQYQDVYPDSTNDDQVQAILDWLYNLDRLDAPN